MGANYVLVEDMFRLGCGCGQGHRMQGIDMCRCSACARESNPMQEMVVGGGQFAAALVPLLDMAPLDAENCALGGAHAGVPANLLMVVAAGRAVITQALHMLARLKVRGGCGSGVAKCAEVLGRVKAEGGGTAKGSGVAPLP